MFVAPYKHHFIHEVWTLRLLEPHSGPEPRNERCQSEVETPAAQALALRNNLRRMVPCGLRNRVSMNKRDLRRYLGR